ncbi:hypothetical protein JHD47_06215 [Sulfurimonas sp. SAG-AH-194-L11]|nr:hypothetical protein [Sulfurimonas sp. SAG-AH-194-L11]MDF1877408.1 hypothetical protein [Sulfurimonas sp. SAG-AH-194-L11]
MNNLYKIIITLAIVIFTGCGNNSDTDTALVDEESEVLLLSAVKLSDMRVRVYDSSYEVTNAMYLDLNKSLYAMDRMTQSITSTLDVNLKLLNEVAKPFEIFASYSTMFSVDNNYTATSPAFVITEPLTLNYFLVSSENRFFNEGMTVKTLFTDSTTLGSAWVRAISDANSSKDLYLGLQELDSNGNVNKISNSFKITAAKLSSL